MAIRFYRPRNAGSGLDLYIDPDTFTQAGDNAELSLIQEIQSLSDVLRADIAISKGFQDIASYDASLVDKSDEILDRLDFYSYENRLESFNVRDGAWFVPDAIVDVCGEEVGNEAIMAIDGVNSTQWRHNVTERHTLTVQLRPYPKKITKIRIRHGAGAPDREQLQNIDIRASKSLAGILNPNNQVLTAANPIWVAGDWTEIPLDKNKANARFIRIISDTIRGDNFIQIRELEVRVETREP